MSGRVRLHHSSRDGLELAGVVDDAKAGSKFFTHEIQAAAGDQEHVLRPDRRDIVREPRRDLSEPRTEREQASDQHDFGVEQ